MSEPCTIIVLPFVSGGPREPARMPPADQKLLPSSDRRNITELWRVRLEREQAELVERPCDDG
jgi:hypothetical protein